MGSTRYERGRAAEYKAMIDLRADGWQCARTAGSHGHADVIAWNASDIRFIQVKTFLTKRIPTFTVDIADLATMVLPPYATAELWAHRQGSHGWTQQVTLRSTHIPPLSHTPPVPTPRPNPTPGVPHRKKPTA